MTQKTRKNKTVISGIKWGDDGKKDFFGMSITKNIFDICAHENFVVLDDHGVVPRKYNDDFYITVKKYLPGETKMKLIIEKPCKKSNWFFVKEENSDHGIVMITLHETFCTRHEMAVGEFNAKKEVTLKYYSELGYSQNKLIDCMPHYFDYDYESEIKEGMKKIIAELENLKNISVQVGKGTFSPNDLKISTEKPNTATNIQKNVTDDKSNLSSTGKHAENKVITAQDDEEDSDLETDESDIMVNFLIDKFFNIMKEKIGPKAKSYLYKLITKAKENIKENDSIYQIIMKIFNALENFDAEFKEACTNKFKKQTFFTMDFDSAIEIYLKNTKIINDYNKVKVGAIIASIVALSVVSKKVKLTENEIKKITVNTIHTILAQLYYSCHYLGDLDVQNVLTLAITFVYSLIINFVKEDEKRDYSKCIEVAFYGAHKMLRSYLMQVYNIYHEWQVKQYKFGPNVITNIIELIFVEIKKEKECLCMHKKCLCKQMLVNIDFKKLQATEILKQINSLKPDN